ncbi:MAG: hypothetical protein OHK0039_16280 [Bacteroidia bacterium]
MQAPHLQKNQPLPPSLDYDGLRQEGIDLAQRLSGDIWTDYNPHDPGVTILEQLCYAITELSYKARLPMEDLLYAKGDVPLQPADHAMFPPQDILPAAPLTLRDYRKLLIDSIPEVRNAWLEPLGSDGQGIDMQGLYRVYLQLVPGAEAEADRICRAVADLLKAHRNLCEDFDAVHVLEPEPVTLSTRLQISPNASGESLLAEVLFAVAEALTPQVRFYTFDELREQGADLSSIFDGPLPRHGFIRDEDLAASELDDLRTLYPSRLVQLIGQVDGVLSVEDFQLVINGSPVRQERVRLESLRYPELYVQALLTETDMLPVSLEIGDITYQVDRDTVLRTYDMLVARHRQQYERPLEVPFDPPHTTRTLASISAYHSIQGHFPEVYGIGEQGLPSRASRQRRAQAKQLRAYLLLFEQLMANYLAQLVQVRHLFSTRGGPDQTYFYQTLFHLPGVAALLGLPQEAFEQELAQLVARFDDPQQRRHRVVDHLLARFGESFLTDAFHTLNRQAGGESGSEYSETLLQAKLQYLQNYLLISRDRGRGVGYHEGDSTGLSGLKQRVALFFGLRDPSASHLSGILADKDRSLHLSREVADKPAAEGFSFRSASPDILSEILAHGINRNLYHVRTEGDKAAIYFRPPGGEEQWVSQTESIEAAEAALTQLIAHLRELNRRSEGFHLVEHLLLRPVASQRQRWVVTDEQTPLLMGPYVTGDPAAAQRSLLKALEQGAAKERYRVGSEGKERDQRFFVLLLDEGGKELARSEAFLVEESAQAHVEVLRKFVEKQKKKGFSASLHLEHRIAPGAMIDGEDPYSLQLSMIFPAWTARFQNLKLQQSLEQIVRTYTPAHLHVWFFPLGLAAMREFEQVYHAWQGEKRRATPDEEVLDELSFFLLLLLKSYRLERQPDYANRPYDADLVARELPGLRKRYQTAVSLFDA